VDQLSSVFLAGDLLSLAGSNTHVVQYEAIYNSRITAVNNSTILTFLWNCMMTCTGLQHASLPCFYWNLRWQQWAEFIFFLIHFSHSSRWFWLLCHVLRMRIFLLSFLASTRTLLSLWYAMTWWFFIKFFFLTTPGRLLPCCWTLQVRWQLICTSWTAIQNLCRDGKL
jgi:hypothetical protein